MDTKNAPFQKERSASLSIAVDTNVSSLVRTAVQANTPKPFVAIYPEPGNNLSRFLVQGYLDAQEIGLAAQALIDLLDSIHGDPDCEEDDPCGQIDEDGVNTLEILACGHGPGCTIADPDCAVDDKPCDPLEEDGV